MKHDNTFNNNRIQHPKQKKRENASNDSRKTDNDNRPKKTNTNKSNQKTIVIIVRHSDYRASDIDNQVTTILDCAVETGLLVDDSISKVGGVFAFSVKVPKGKEGFDLIILGD